MTEITSRLSTALADRYRLERHLGEGGMATVYLAEDLKHKRKVAVKVLRPELAAVLGAERFVQEITTTANLQHPHILPLFDSGEADSFLYYVMPYIEGETLRDKLNREKQLGVEETVEITKAVASALDYAHEQGIVHRDIKPENILLQRGQALVADFGIALAVSAAGGTRLTETGLSLGTPQYMSPEQATGDRELDARSDVYSLGAVTYEMLTGDPPHTASTVQAIIAKILAERPSPITQSRDMVPANVDAAVQRALAKSPADRFTTAGEFVDALTNPAFMLPQTQETASGAGVGGRWNRLTVGLAVATALMVVVAVGGRLWPSPKHASSSVTRLTVQLPGDHFLERLGPGPGVAVSPDGENLVFVARRGDTAQLFFRSLNDFDAMPLPATSDAWGPFFSPDGAWVGFFAQGRLKKVSLAGGAPITLAEVGDVGGASWGEDGWIVFDNWPKPGLWRVREAGGQVELIDGTDRYEGLLWPQILPEGRGILATRLGSKEFTALAIYDAKRGELRDLIEPASYARFIPTGHVVYAWAGELFVVPFDRDRLNITGTPQPVLQGVMTDRIRPRFTSTSTGFLTGKVPHFAVARTGLLVYVPGRDLPPARTLAWVDANGVQDIPLAPGDYAAPRVSPDNRMLGYGNRRQETFSIWTYDLVRRVERPLTDDAGGDFWPLWMPDGRGIVFTSNRYSADSSIGNLFEVALGSTASPQRLGHNAQWQQPQSWAPGGERLVFTGSGQGMDVMVATLDEIDAPDTVVKYPGNQMHARVSPDGQWIAYASDETGRSEVYVRRFDGTGAPFQVSVEGGHEPLWAPDQRTVYYRDYGGDRIMAVLIQLGADRLSVVGDPAVLVEGSFFEGRVVGRNYDLAPNGRRFLVIREPEPQRAQRLHVVINWFEELKAKVGN